MTFEVEFKLNGKVIKRISLEYQKTICFLEVSELREDFKTGKEIMYPVFMHTHKLFYDARLEFLGIVSEAAYENANNTQDTNRENIFVRGSLSLSNGKYK